MSAVEKSLLVVAVVILGASFVASSNIGAIRLTLVALCLIAFAVAIR